jgi:hypothetical protein
VPVRQSIEARRTQPRWRKSLPLLPRLEFVVRISPNNVALSISVKPPKNIALGIAEVLLVESEVEILGLHRPMRRKHSLDTATDSVAPVEITAPCVEEVWLNMKPARVIGSNCATRSVNQPANRANQELRRRVRAAS